MRWKKRRAEIERLRREHPTLSVYAMPDLRCEGPKYPSLSSTGAARVMERGPRAAPVLTVPDVFVGTPHKQGPMLMFRDELPQGGGKKS